jgi:hypothetical protein
MSRALGRPHFGHTSRSAEFFRDALRRGCGLGDPAVLSPLRADIGTSVFPRTDEHGLSADGLLPMLTDACPMAGRRLTNAGWRFWNDWQVYTLSKSA